MVTVTKLAAGLGARLLLVFFFIILFCAMGAAALPLLTLGSMPLSRVLVTEERRSRTPNNFYGSLE